MGFPYFKGRTLTAFVDHVNLITDFWFVKFGLIAIFLVTLLAFRKNGATASFMLASFVGFVTSIMFLSIGWVGEQWVAIFAGALIVSVIFGEYVLR